MVRINDRNLIEQLLSIAGPELDRERASSDLTELYSIDYHKSSDSLVISSRGAVLYCHSPRSLTPYLVFHRGVAVYRPEIGCEMVNVGLVGDVYSGEVIVRSESACSPSFLYGSQRCNCFHQWECVSELAAKAGGVTAPDRTSGHRFERWVQDQVELIDGQVKFKDPADRGFVMLHLDSQNGMGSGYTSGDPAQDLYVRASMRHRGEYAAEQAHGASMAGAFRSLGLPPDPRKEDGGVGYQTPFIVLDSLGVSENLIFLSNNPLKWRHALAKPYEITPIRMIGEVNLAGAEEAESRHDQFGHDSIGEIVSFDEEYERLSRELGL